jgi:hypothetical protein
MITLKDVHSAKKFLRKMYAKSYPYYNPKNNDVSYELCTMSNTERSDSVEVIVMKMFENSGQNIYKMGRTNKRYDLLANEEKIEIKSSLAKQHTPSNNVYYTYTFSHIKPECFDRLVLVYITPNGLKFRILTQKAVYNIIRSKGLKAGPDGYSICHNKNSRILGKNLHSFLGLTTDKNRV